MLEFKVEEVPHEKGKIVIRFKLRDLGFVMTGGLLSLYFNTDDADKVSFQINSLLEDIERVEKNDFPYDNPDKERDIIENPMPNQLLRE